MIKKFLLVFLILLCSFSFAFAGDGSKEINVPYAQPAAGQHDGWITVYTSDDKTYTYFWHCDNKGSSVSRYVHVSCDLSNPDKIKFNFSHTGSDSTYFYLTHSTLGGGGISLNYSGTIQRQSNTSITLNPTGDITYVVYGGNIALNSIPSSIGRLDVIWGGDSQIYSTISSIYSRLGTINTNIADIESAIKLTYSEVELISSQLSNYIDDFGSLLSMIENQGGYIELLHELSTYINTKLGNILSILEEFRDAYLTNSEDLPSEDITDSIQSEQEVISGTDKSDSFDDVITSVDFGQFSGGFQLFWTLVDRLFATNPIFVILTVMCLSLGLISFIFNRR